MHSQLFNSLSPQVMGRAIVWVQEVGDRIWRAKCMTSSVFSASSRVSSLSTMVLSGRPLGKELVFCDFLGRGFEFHFPRMSHCLPFSALQLSVLLSITCLWTQCLSVLVDSNCGQTYLRPCEFEPLFIACLCSSVISEWKNE